MIDWSKKDIREGLASLKEDKRDKDMPRASAPGVEVEEEDNEEEEEEKVDDVDDDKVENGDDFAVAEAAEEKNGIDIAGEFLPEVDDRIADIVDAAEEEAIKRYVLAHLA